MVTWGLIQTKTDFSTKKQVSSPIHFHVDSVLQSTVTLQQKNKAESILRKKCNLTWHYGGPSDWSELNPWGITKTSIYIYKWTNTPTTQKTYGDHCKPLIQSKTALKHLTWVWAKKKRGLEDVNWFNCEWECVCVCVCVCGHSYYNLSKVQSLWDHHEVTVGFSGIPQELSVIDKHECIGIEGEL